MNPYFSETYCFECDTRINTNELENCLKGKDHLGECEFICPKCNNPSITACVACGLRKEPYPCQLPNTAFTVSEDQITEEIQCLIGKYVTTYSICEMLLANIATEHDDNLRKQEEDDTSDNPTMSAYKNSLNKADLSKDPALRKMRQEIDTLAKKAIKTRNHIAHGRFTYIIDETKKPSEPIKITIPPDGESPNNILPNYPIGKFGYIKNNKLILLDKKTLSKKIEILERLKDVAKKMVYHQLRILHSGEALCANAADNDDCPCIKEANTWKEIIQKEKIYQSQDSQADYPTPTFHITPSGLTIWPTK